jgi:hypothetical protein
MADKIAALKETVHLGRCGRIQTPPPVISDLFSFIKRRAIVPFDLLWTRRRNGI